jgi:sporulation protein YlmC with PRC-barrel domain
MDIPIHAHVTCYDGIVGNSSHIIVDLVTEQVTNFVVKTDHEGKQFVVPIDKIEGSERTFIMLNCHKEDVYQLPLFDESHFNGYDTYNSAPPVPSPGIDASNTLYHPYREAETGAQAPPSESSWARLAINKGAMVLATDGDVGKIDEFVIDPESHRVTHLVLRQHFLLNKWIVTIPVSEIERVEVDTIFLKIDKEAVKTLPYVGLKRFPWE